MAKKIKTTIDISDFQCEIYKLKIWFDKQDTLERQIRVFIGNEYSDEFEFFVEKFDDGSTLSVTNSIDSSYITANGGYAIDSDLLLEPHNYSASNNSCSIYYRKEDAEIATNKLHKYIAEQLDAVVEYRRRELNSLEKRLNETKYYNRFKNLDQIN